MSGEDGGLRRLDLRIERLGFQFRFTFAFHAREIRFEVDRGEGFERIFPETFSFHRDLHDPMELLFQLNDLVNRPELLSPRARSRDSRELVARLVALAPIYLDDLAKAVAPRLPEAARLRFYQDLGLFCQLAGRLLITQQFNDERRGRIALLALRKIVYRSLLELVEGRVEPAYLERYIHGEVDPIDPSDDPSEAGFFHTMESGDAEAVNRMVVRMAERSFFLWLESTCLDEENQAFEKGDSPFDDRETEVLRAICTGDELEIERGHDLVPFLRRPSKDSKRLLDRLERFFLRRYDIRTSSALIHHEASLDRGLDTAETHLSFHTPRNHVIALLVMIAPFVAAAFFYDTNPRLFDLVCATEVGLIHVAAAWYLLYKFCWRRDLAFFYASVPRIGAGIIVGYLPVFLIDEVWDLATQPAVILGAVGTMLGLVTLLYIYVEVRQRLQDHEAAFARARAIFVFGLLQAFTFGIVMTNFVGRFMAMRNWSHEVPDASPTLAEIGAHMFVGQLPLVIGADPMLAFPSAVFLMTFLSFFIGVFLQLMWEDLPITEPL